MKCKDSLKQVNTRVVNFYFLEKTICNQRDWQFGEKKKRIGELSGSKLSISQLIIPNYTPTKIMLRKCGGVKEKKAFLLSRMKKK